MCDCADIYRGCIKTKMVKCSRDGEMFQRRREKVSENRSRTSHSSISTRRF